ncbi:MAG: S8 family serine peptidase [Solirubrobacterales bacterium]
MSKQHFNLSKQIAGLGAVVVRSSLVPNVLVIRADRLTAGRASRLPLVKAVESASLHSATGGSAIDGSPTWIQAGCTGGGPSDVGCPPATGAPGAVESSDGNGGPDIAIWDSGVNLFHTAFDGRTPRIVTPASRQTGSSTSNPCEGEAPVNGFWCPHGGEHGNAIAAIAASQDPGHLGMAPGIDKILDPLRAQSESSWLTGLPFNGEAPAPDLPEVVNYSAGGNELSADDDYSTREVDLFVSLFGIARSGAAGNDGPSGPNPEARVSAPCIAWNALCMGAMTPTGPTRAGDVVASYSSRGPTFGGRKKPDLLAYGVDGCPSDDDFKTWEGNCGQGTSFAAPRGAAAIALLASVGITDTSAQRAILINSSYMVPSEYDRFPGTEPARYWTPDAGWGELALEQTYPKRGNYALGSVTAAAGSNPGPNSARFFRVNGMVAGERTTLAWNRRVTAPQWPDASSVAPFTTTDLDLFQYTTSGTDNDDDVACAIPVQTVVNSCGVDANELSERLGPHPAPGNADAYDNVEQVRAKIAGSAIIKVKAASGLTGATSEPFALASDRQLIPISTPTINIPRPTLSAPAVTTGQDVVVTADISNNSTGADLATGLMLGSATASIQLPAGVSLASEPTCALSNARLNPSEHETCTWTVRGNVSAMHQITVSARGERFNEVFQTTSLPASLTVDSNPPTASIVAPSDWYQARTAMVSWSSSDDLSSISNVKVEASIDGAPWVEVSSSNGSGGSVGVTAEEGQEVKTRVIATDALGNQSAPVESTSWKVDADAPTLGVLAPSEVAYGEPAYITIRSFNIGAPVQNYVRSGNSQVFQPLTSEVFLVPSVARLGLPLTIEAQAIDSLNRITRKSVTITTRARPMKMQMKKVRRGRGQALSFKLSVKTPGTISVTAKCGRKKSRKRTLVESSTKAVIALGRLKGKCAITATFFPTASYQYESVKVAKRFKL